MNTIQHSQIFLRKRKMMMVLPLLVLPFITLLFWALGGGNATAATVQQTNNDKGLNLQLPNASLKQDRMLDKMAYYQKAAADSARLKDLIKSDPNRTLYPGNLDAMLDDSILPTQPVNEIDKTFSLPAEQKVYSKLSELNKVLAQVPVRAPVQNTEEPPSIQHQSSPAQTRLEKLMEQMNTKGSENDTEINQLNGMLEKILDIQHPQRVEERFNQQRPLTSEQPYRVITEPVMAGVSLLDSCIGLNANNYTNKFFGLDDKANKAVSQDAIESVVEQTQTLVSGAIIKMRLLNDICIGNNIITKDHFIYGTVTLDNERLVVTIRSIRDENAIYPVKMMAYDMDGLPGIYIPGAITRDVFKQSTGNAIQSLSLNSVDPSLGAQAASAGIETAKQLFSKKAKLVKVQVRAGYKILLKDTELK